MKNEPRPIDANRLVRIAGTRCGVVNIKHIDDCPTLDVVPVVHGRWIIKSEIHRMLDDFDEEFYVECPLCGRTFCIPFEFDDGKMLAYAKEKYPYCNCGAKMDGGNDDA